MQAMLLPYGDAARRTMRRRPHSLLLLLMIAAAAAVGAPRGCGAAQAAAGAGLLSRIRALLGGAAPQHGPGASAGPAPLGAAVQQPTADADAALAAEAFASITGAGGGAAAAAPARVGPARVRTLSWQPRAMLWEGFMSDAEADHLLALGKESLAASDVVDSATGKFKRSKERTSSGAFVPSRRHDAVVAELEARIARWTQIPEGNGEPFHILRYEPTQQYTAHFDYFHDDVHVKNGGQRLATVILYLSEVEEGGETVFPDSPTRPGAAEAQGFSECAHAGLGVRPHKGDALLFFSLKPDGQTPDTSSLHAGCPVIRGTKYIATKWIRVDHYHDWGEGAAEEAEAAAAGGGGDGPSVEEGEEGAAAGAGAGDAAVGDEGEAGGAAGGEPDGDSEAEGDHSEL